MKNAVCGNIHYAYSRHVKSQMFVLSGIKEKQTNALASL